MPFKALFLGLEPRFCWQKYAFKNDAGISNKGNGHRPPNETGRIISQPFAFEAKRNQRLHFATF
jgi:hypothetical protein